MVSTRGPRYKFSEGEKVLCYEPDLTKAKVLYDSKVLEVIKIKDKRGRPVIEYLIHFQGWNSSWDRCVGEDFVLKDTEENRQLQRSLAEKSQLQIGAYLYRRERKKTTTSTSTNSSSTTNEKKGFKRGFEGEGSSSSCDPEEREERNSESSTESESSCTTIEDQKPEINQDSSPTISNAVINLGPGVRERLTLDCQLITNGYFVSLPSKPSVVEILEGCVKEYTLREINAKFRPRRSRVPNPQPPEEQLAELVNKFNILIEIADGIRIYFDYCLNGHLLYSPEYSQYKDGVVKNVIAEAQSLSREKDEDHNMNKSIVKTEVESADESAYQSSSPMNDEVHIKTEQPTTSVRRLRSHKLSQASETSEENVPITNNTEAASNSVSGSPGPADNVPNLTCDIKASIADMKEQANRWAIVPENYPPFPSSVYGATHLARLFVKLPEFLNAINMAEMKLNLIIKNIDIFIDYLEDHEEWFGESHYYEANPGPS